MSALQIRIHKSTKYFKRELFPATSLQMGIPEYIPAGLYKWLLPDQMFPIHFSIPEEMITKVGAAQKQKLFVSGMVDEEISKRLNEDYIPLNSEKYKFDNQKDYYADIQISKFGITTKRSGWDCMRHYEFAANGAVLCFKDLDKKPENCAPHSLNRHNCITYSDYDDLLRQIDQIDEEGYNQLLSNSYKWVQANTTITLARTLLSTL